MEILGYLILLLFAVFFAISFFVILGYLFPFKLRTVQQVVKTRPKPSVLTGLVLTLLLVGGFVGLVRLADLTGLKLLSFIALFLGIIYLIALMFGLTAMTQMIGMRLNPMGIPLHRNILGAAVLILICLVPFLGWFGFLPFFGFIGAGAFVLSFS